MLLTGLMACSGGKEKEVNRKAQRTEPENLKREGREDAVLQVELFVNADSSFGYRIIRSGKLYIHQPNIPAVPGTGGFSSEKEARKVAELMIHKINLHIMPPGVSKQELDSLEVRYKN